MGGIPAMSKLSISEIFGPTIQGEGALIGESTVFVRAGGRRSGRRRKSPCQYARRDRARHEVDGRPLDCRPGTPQFALALTCPSVNRTASMVLARWPIPQLQTTFTNKNNTLRPLTSKRRYVSIHDPLLKTSPP